MNDPVFSARETGIGLEDDEVVVCAWLAGSNYVPHWELRALLSGENDGKTHFVDLNSDAKAIFGLMGWDSGNAPWVGFC